MCISDIMNGMTLLIKNVKVLGGEGRSANETNRQGSDIFIQGDKISAIGTFPNKKAGEVIDGQGAYLAPGFIDVNTDSDHYLSLFEYPSQDDFLKQGVTTIIGGMCGASLAPLLYGSLESIRKWVDTSRFNVNWHTMREFLLSIEKRGLGVNFGTLAGHSTIRRAVVGDKIRELTKNEAEIFGSVARRALEEGGLGLSTGLGYVHSYKTPYSEIKLLANIVKEYDGVYATHLRKNGAEVGESVDETIQVAEETGVKTNISHFMPLRGSEEEYVKALEKISHVPGDLDFSFDVYPFDTSILTLYSFLPVWVQNTRERMVASIKDSWLQQKIKRDFPNVNPDDITVAQAPGNEFLVGKSLGDLSKMYNAPDYQSALLQLMLVTELKCVVFHKNIAAPLIAEAVRHPRSLIASNAASFRESDSVLKPERATKTFTKFLKLVEGEKLMPLEDAVKKITLMPAKKFGLKNRGVVREGAFADLVIFKDASVKTVIVNGIIAVKDGLFEGRLAGRVLRK